MGNAWAHVFDLGNVLIFVHEERFFSTVTAAARAGTPVRQLFSEAFDRADVARGGDFETIYPQLVAGAGLTLTRDEFRLAWNDIFSRNPPMLKLLAEVPRPRVLLSNTNCPHIVWIREHFPEVFPSFDHVVLSSEVGLAKPEAGIYRHVEALTGLPAERHLFTDDLEENLAGARACGWAVLPFTGVEEYRRGRKQLTNGPGR